MGSENEPAKLLLPYLQRADELQKHETLVAYYCRLYAMEKGLRIPQNERTKTTNSLLISLMNQLEKDKKSLNLGPEDNLYLEGFALNVFGKADKQDRAGRADLNTAKTFYAASIFFEIITQFGALQPDLEQKQKYAVWKAADIRKALKEGRKPNPGPPADDENLSIPSSTPSGGYDLGPSESAASNARPESDPSPQFHDQVNDEPYTNIPPSPLFHDKQADQRILHMLNRTTINPTRKNLNHICHKITNLMNLPHTLIPTSSLIQVSQRVVSHQYHHINHHTIRVLILRTAPSRPPPTSSYSSTPQYPSSSIMRTTSDPASTSAKTYQYDINYQPPPEKIVEAHKAARFAVGALAFDDVSVAVDYLRKSLELLTNPSVGQ
ncbi:hypothetical protein H0E87_020676 [Populus deltoides]|uniref:Hydroxyproline-rich glycoprotein family protein n=1 Tax=Populus deltoides TaxID=3696 RepID=A0A8T2XLY8_POPDE|nr:hypothetical protein H0E87_020676 [Populus deltoides]